MQDRELQQQIKRVIVSLDFLVQLLENLGTPAEISKAKNWKSILQATSAPDHISEIWREMQEIGMHMGYMDYADPTFDAVVTDLLEQMQNVIASTRQRS
jgi:hypothetical protein